jgi:hypothetical protein
VERVVGFLIWVRVRGFILLYTTLITSYILKVTLVVFKQRHCHIQDP